ncbi:hypothetical protein LWI28_008845 [Acer negundo]|uniref:Uncharacterized protein n=1 Tax=Acer negundo TaxID=4023 RepID=A0AAD5IUP9_ACENE|nr:hypothetical protein LWI28_008845 [Acer negundo]KAK4845791.1 hypothetical protein QYF36_009141 [Acer negundo]
MCRGIQEHHQANNKLTTTSLISCSSREIHVSSSHVNSSGATSGCMKLTSWLAGMSGAFYVTPVKTSLTDILLESLLKLRFQLF